MSSQRQIWFLLSGQGGSRVLSQYIKVRPLATPDTHQYFTAEYLIIIQDNPKTAVCKKLSLDGVRFGVKYKF